MEDVANKNSTKRLSRFRSRPQPKDLRLSFVLPKSSFMFMLYFTDPAAYAFQLKIDNRWFNEWGVEAGHMLYQFQQLIAKIDLSVSGWQRLM